MNISLMVPVLSQMVGRDLTKELNMFYRARAAIGRSLNNEEQILFINNYPQIVDFMESEEGQKALAKFFETWILSLVPKTQPQIPEEKSEQ